MKKSSRAFARDLRELVRRALAIVPAEEALDWRATKAAVWVDEGLRTGFHAHADLDDVALDDLFWIDDQKAAIETNTRQFLAGLPANNVLLWGARGTGKSSLIHGLLNRYAAQGLRLVEVNKGRLAALPEIVRRLRDEPFRFILFCDDLSFDETETGYRELKALLQGGIEAPPPNVMIYATANRRHLLPERFEANTGEAEIHPEEALSEKLSLSDRFGITLGFYPVSQSLYLDIVRHLAQQRLLQINAPDLEREALQWALLRGARSGRVARQFVDDLTGRLGLEAGKSVP
jgi:uncharacterized protein